MKQRIQKVVAGAGVASRRVVEEMILQGRVAVNGKVVTRLPVLIDPDQDRVEVDGEQVRLKGPGSPRRMYFLLNKPRGIYSTNVAQGAQIRAIDLLPPELRDARLYPVGRLDAESKGLLLLTNDGELTNLLTHPRYGVPKTYRAVVDGHVSPLVIGQLEKGIWLSDPHGGKGIKTGASEIKIAKKLPGKSVLDIVVREGINPEIRRALAKLGHKVRELTRTRMGPLTLEGVPLGRFRPLAPKEIRQLRQYSKEKVKSKK